MIQTNLRFVSGTREKKMRPQRYYNSVPVSRGPGDWQAAFGDTYRPLEEGLSVTARPDTHGEELGPPGKANLIRGASLFVVRLEHLSLCARARVCEERWQPLDD